MLRVAWILVIEKEVIHAKSLEKISFFVELIVGSLPSAALYQANFNFSLVRGREFLSQSVKLSSSSAREACSTHFEHDPINMTQQAKGYPDISTRHFLHLLSQAPDIPKPPIYGLMDFDPDGMSIMSTYKYGSWQLSHENHHLNVPELQWLGIQSEDLMGIIMDNHAASGLLALSVRDRKRAFKMLTKDELAENGRERQWRRELQVMLMLNMKAEMEILNEREGGMEAWLERKLIHLGRVGDRERGTEQV